MQMGTWTSIHRYDIADGQYMSFDGGRTKINNIGSFFFKKTKHIPDAILNYIAKSVNYTLVGLIIINLVCGLVEGLARRIK